MLTKTLESMTSHLNQIRVKYGEDAYLAAAKDVAVQLYRQGGSMRKYVREAFADTLDFDEIERIAAEPQQKPNDVSPGDAVPPDFLEMLRAQVPGITTQAHLNVFVAAFDALRLTLGSIFEKSTELEEQGRQALELAFDTAHKVVEATDQVCAAPEAVAGTNPFKPEAGVTPEADLQAELLKELAAIQDGHALTAWYSDSRTRFDRIVTITLRNELFDKIRARVIALS